MEAEKAETAWVFREQQPGAEWTRLRAEDGRALEAALPSAAGTGRTSLWGGRWEARLGDSVGAADQGEADQHWSVGEMHALYEDVGPLRLARTLWSYRCWPNGSWAPFAPEDDATLEAAWSGFTSGATYVEMSEVVTTDGKHRVSFKRQRDGEPAIVMRPLTTEWTVKGVTTSWSAPLTRPPRGGNARARRVRPPLARTRQVRAARLGRRRALRALGRGDRVPDAPAQGSRARRPRDRRVVVEHQAGVNLHSSCWHGVRAGLGGQTTAERCTRAVS